MSLADTRAAQLFPVLTGQQIEQAGRFASGPRRRYAAGEAVFAAGQRDTPAFLVTAGELAVTGEDRD